MASSSSSTHLDHHDDHDDAKKAADVAIEKEPAVADDSSSANVTTIASINQLSLSDLPPRKAPVEEHAAPHDSNSNQHHATNEDGSRPTSRIVDSTGETEVAAGARKKLEDDSEQDQPADEADPSVSVGTTTATTTTAKTKTNAAADASTSTTPTTTNGNPNHPKLVVHCGFRGGSIAQFPGNVAYVQEMKFYRTEFLQATRQQNTTERDRIVNHFLDRYMFVEDRTGRPLTLEQARDKMHKSLGDPRRKSSSTTVKESPKFKTNAQSAADPDEVPSTSYNNNDPVGEEMDTNNNNNNNNNNTPVEEEEEKVVDKDSAGKYLVQCGFRGGSIAKYPGNVAYVDEMKDYRGAYLNALEDSAERHEIIQHFLNRFTFVDYTTQRPIPPEEAVARIHRGLNDPRREIREPAASISPAQTNMDQEHSSSAGRLRLSRAAKEDAVTKIETIAALGTIPKNASSKSNNRSQLLTQQQQEQQSLDESDEEEDDEPVPDGDNDNDDEDDASSTRIPDEDSDGLDDKGRLVVRCGEHRFRNWPGNVAYWHEMRDLRGDYLAATANSDERKWIIDNFLGNYVFVWGSSSHQKRLSTKEATEKIVISLRDSRKGVRVLDSDDENDGEIIREDPGLLDDEDEDVEQENEEPEEEQNEEDSKEEEEVADDDEDNNDAAAQEEEEDAPDDDASSHASSSTNSLSGKKKIIVRLGQGHTKRPGNMAYVEEMTDRRGEFLDLDEDNPKRERIIQHFLRKYSFVNAGGHPTDESFAYQKIRLSLKDARMPTRRNSNRKRRRIR